jgi:hypothetical protein
MRYKPKGVAALQMILGGFPDTMRVETDDNIGVSAKTVGELRLPRWAITGHHGPIRGYGDWNSFGTLRGGTP